MKKYLILITGIALFTLTSFTVVVPKVVSAAFAKKFPAATNIKWAKENAKEYEAAFNINGKSASANFLTNGSWVETEMEINTADLPAAVANTIKLKYATAVILKTYKIENAKGAVTYEAEIKTGSKKTELVMNADGTILK